MKGRQAGELTDVEITTQMIEAGVADLREKAFGEPLEEVVQSVFYAMLAASPTSSS